MMKIICVMSYKVTAVTYSDTSIKVTIKENPSDSLLVTNLGGPEHINIAIYSRNFNANHCVTSLCNLLAHLSNNSLVGTLIEFYAYLI